MKVFQLFWTPEKGHMFAHKIFDGDGIFLHKQGDRMQRDGLTYMNYNTPGSADIMVNAFRRYVNAAAKKTKEVGEPSMADSVMPPPINGYNDNLPRSVMLDRYESHTKHCKLCSAALKTKEKRYQVISTAHNACVGGIGASSTALVAIVFLSVASQVTVSAAITRAAAALVLFTSGISTLLSKYKAKLYDQIREFKFEDYIPAEKD